MPPALFYALLQLPGLAIVSGLLYVAWRADFVGPAGAAALIAFWIGKDVALYPFMRSAVTRAPSRLVGPDTLIGQVATVETRLDPRGVIRLKSERWTAETPPGTPPVAAGARVRVVEMRDLVLLATPLEEPGASGE